MSQRTLVERIVAVACLGAAVVVTAMVLTRDGSSTIHARFLNAGGLVAGGRVEIAGRKVGQIADVRLTTNGLAEVTLSLDAGTPLRRGTRASIRALGQAGIANRFVDLSPGPPDAPALPDGAVLGTDQTSGIVNVDALLDSFDPRARANMRRLIEHSADIYAGSGSRTFNQMLGRMAPAFSQLNRTYGELALDRQALGELVRTAEQSASAIASRRRDLGEAVENTARMFDAVARARGALAESLTRAPAVLRQARGTLAATDRAVTTLRPTLRDILPTGRPLREYLRQLTEFLPRAEPVVGELLHQLPDLRRSLAGLRPLQDPAVTAIGTTGTTMADLRHILEGLRFYGSDLVIGALGAIGGISTGKYDALGHYGKTSFVQNAQTIVGGPLAEALSARPLVPGLLGVRTGLTRRCPGGNVPPAPDGSSPWDLGEKFCSASHNTPASVNRP